MLTPETSSQFNHILLGLYRKEGVPYERLAYSEAFDRIHQAMLDAGYSLTKNGLWRHFVFLEEKHLLPTGYWLNPPPTLPQF